jgi:hypothetical protein
MRGIFILRDERVKSQPLDQIKCLKFFTHTIISSSLFLLARLFINDFSTSSLLLSHLLDSAPSILVLVRFLSFLKTQSSLVPNPAPLHLTDLSTHLHRFGTIYLLCIFCKDRHRILCSWLPFCFTIILYIKICNFG